MKNFEFFEFFGWVGGGWVSRWDYARLDRGKGNQKTGLVCQIVVSYTSHPPSPPWSQENYLLKKKRKNEAKKKQKNKEYKIKAENIKIRGGGAT